MICDGSPRFRSGDLDLATHLVSAIGDLDLQATAVTEVATAAFAAGDHDRAGVTAKSIPWPDLRSTAVAILSAAAAEAGDWALALSMR